MMKLVEIELENFRCYKNKKIPFEVTRNRFHIKTHEFGPLFHKYFHMHYKKEAGHFEYVEPNLKVIRDELDLCGYFSSSRQRRWTPKRRLDYIKTEIYQKKYFGGQILF